MVRTLAGVYTTTRPTQGVSDRNFQRVGVLAALFAMGTISELPSTRQVVRAQVNANFVIFMLLPLMLAFAFFGIAHVTRTRVLPLFPTTQWELMIMAKESPDIPYRLNPAVEDFPEHDEQLGLCFFDAAQVADDPTIEHTAGLVIRSMPKTKTKLETLKTNGPSKTDSGYGESMADME
jgi:hypothetical protein